jgi:hypothetical protein
LDHKRSGEIGAIRWERSRHDVHPFQNMIFVSIHCPHSLPQSLRQPTLELFMKRSTKPQALIAHVRFQHTDDGLGQHHTFEARGRTAAHARLTLPARPGLCVGRSWPASRAPGERLCAWRRVASRETRDVPDDLGNGMYAPPLGGGVRGG